MTTLPPDYDALSAAEKLDSLWERVTAEAYPEGALPTGAPALDALKVFSVAHGRVSFEHVSDEVPAGRAKVIHRHGSCARVTVRFTGEHPYTGVFATGGPALLRLSDSAGRPPLAVGAALKFLVDGGPSLNYFGMPQKAAKPPRGFLSPVLANNVPGADDLPGLKNLGPRLVAKRFDTTAKALGGTRLYGNYLPLHHLAGRTLSGAEVAEPVVPDRLELRATDDALDAVGREGDWRVRLTKLAAGTRLYELRLAPAIDQPAEVAGELVMDTPFVASRFGDEQLWFQHDVGPTS